MTMQANTELTAAVLNGVTEAYKSAPDKIPFAEICELLMGMAIEFDQDYLPWNICDAYMNLMRDKDRSQPYNPMLESTVVMLLEYAAFFVKAAAIFSNELKYERNDIIKTLRFQASDGC